MPSSGVRIRVWCEDHEHEAFGRELLTRVWGIHPKALDFRIAPSGEGAASTWVRKQYSSSVLLEHQKARKQSRLGFLVLIDGDNAGLKGRFAQLEADQRNSTDRIAILVPTWSIETWVLWLTHESVTESESCKERLSPSEFRARLSRAIGHWDEQRTDEARVVPSLKTAREELKRLPRP